MEYGATGVRAHLQGNAGWLYVCNQSLGSNECREWRVVLQQQVSGWVHLPTVILLAKSRSNIEREAYSLHPKSSTAIHHLEEVLIFLTSEPTESCNLKIRPEMAHVVFLSLHRFWVDIWQRGAGWVTTKNFFWERILGLFWLLLFFGLRLHKHLPQPLGSKVVHSLVCGGITENVWYSLLQFLDRNCKSIGLVRFDHLQEWITVLCQ